MVFGGCFRERRGSCQGGVSVRRSSVDLVKGDLVDGVVVVTLFLLGILDIFASCCLLAATMYCTYLCTTSSTSMWESQEGKEEFFGVRLTCAIGKSFTCAKTRFTSARYRCTYYCKDMGCYTAVGIIIIIIYVHWCHYMFINIISRPATYMPTVTF